MPVRVKKTATIDEIVPVSTVSKSTTDGFAKLLDQISASKTEYDQLLKETAETRQQFTDQKNQEQIARKREQETYDYETTLNHKKAEDEFNEKRIKWERELTEQKETLSAEHKELEELRKAVASFPADKDKAVKEACVALQKEIEEKFAAEKKLREQEVKAERDIFTLKVSSLETENGRQTREIEVLKKAFDQATTQVKDIAVRVIEAGNQHLAQPSTP